MRLRRAGVTRIPHCMPQRLAIALAVLHIGLASACSHDAQKAKAQEPAGEPDPSVQPDSIIDVVWTPDAATDAEARAVSSFANEVWRDLSRLLGPARTPDRQIIVRLAGDAEPGQVPTVDPGTGDIVVFRFAGEGGGYDASLAHEMVHAFRWDLWKQEQLQTDTFLFFEEGFAEAAAVQVGRPSKGFPKFGASTAAAAGAWLRDDSPRDMLALISHHRALNFRCMAQAYALRLSFVEFLVEAYGFERLVDLVYTSEPLTSDIVGKHFGISLQDLAGKWYRWASGKLEALDDAEARVTGYLESPVKYLPKCESVSGAATGS